MSLDNLISIFFVGVKESFNVFSLITFLIFFLYLSAVTKTSSAIFIIGGLTIFTIFLMKVILLLGFFDKILTQPNIVVMVALMYWIVIGVFFYVSFLYLRGWINTIKLSCFINSTDFGPNANWIIGSKEQGKKVSLIHLLGAVSVGIIADVLSEASISNQDLYIHLSLEQKAGRVLEIYASSISFSLGLIFFTFIMWLLIFMTARSEKIKKFFLKYFSKWQIVHSAIYFSFSIGLIYLMINKFYKP